jgi:hypothetical protein
MHFTKNSQNRLLASTFDAVLPYSMENNRKANVLCYQKSGYRHVRGSKDEQKKWMTMNVNLESFKYSVRYDL